MAAARLSMVVAGVCLTRGHAGVDKRRAGQGAGGCVRLSLTAPLLPTGGQKPTSTELSQFSSVVAGWGRMSDIGTCVLAASAAASLSAFSLAAFLYRRSTST